VRREYVGTASVYQEAIQYKTKVQTLYCTPVQYCFIEQAHQEGDKCEERASSKTDALRHACLMTRGGTRATPPPLCWGNTPPLVLGKHLGAPGPSHTARSCGSGRQTMPGSTLLECGERGKQSGFPGLGRGAHRRVGGARGTRCSRVKGEKRAKGVGEEHGRAGQGRAGQRAEGQGIGPRGRA